MNNEIRTWAQGCFVDQSRYKDWSETDKKEADRRERLMVRPSPTENAICKCDTPQSAKWVAERLNLASVLEQMTYDFATGKTDGSEIVALVRKHIE
jgi:hypothetical protein